MFRMPNRFIVSKDGEDIGTIRVDYCSKTKSHELSWTIAPEMRGRGLGKLMVAKAVMELDCKIRAEIKETNHASIHIAEFCGFEKYKTHKGINYYLLN